MTSIFGGNHFWQNWPKTHAYVAERMFFPRSPDDIADAIKQAEAQLRPIRAVGSGWSFSDASLPGAVTTNRPDVAGLEALAGVFPRTVTFPTSTTQPSIASVPTGMRGADGMGSMIMIADPGGGIDPGFALWAYSGAGTWTKGNWTYGPTPGFLDYLAQAGDRPVRNPMGAPLEDTDVAGSLVMFDLARSPARPSRDWFYHGKGIWSVGVNGDSPFAQGSLAELKAAGRIGPNSLLSPRAAGSGEAMSLVLSRNSSDTPKLPEPVFLVDLRMLTSSLQQSLPDILSQSALDAMSTNRPVFAGRRFFFHVESGITMPQLRVLLSHQSPRLSLRGNTGSSGGTLAGALSSATHGAEFKWPLLVDTVKAVHMVGPGGHHWWIEGDESIVDPQKLRQAHPEFASERIILGTDTIAGVKPQDWLSAAIVSMGCMGVIYSVVLEVFPFFGVREAVVQTTWRGIGNALANEPMPEPFTQDLPFNTKLRRAGTSRAASRAVLDYLLNGSRNGTGISLANNVHADLAINPNRRADGDFDCWIGNREATIRVPIDPQPPPGSDLGSIVEGVTRAFDGTPNGFQKFRNVYQAGSVWDIVWNLSGTQAKLTRLGRATDLIDVGLDTFLTPMIGHPDGPEVAQVFVSGILAGLMGTANSRARSDKTGLSVGASAFPGSGIMGTALEVALAPADAFGFLVTEILDRIDTARPFFGYISIRITSPTKTLMGMQQFGDSINPQSVMIEVVAFASPSNLQFIRDLQIRTLDRISKGLDAMLHWGLENDRVNGGHLRATMGLRRPASPGISKLDTFKAVRGVLRAASPAQPNVFDNAFTSRLWLNAQVADDDPYSFQSVLQGTRKSTVIAPWNRGNAPMRIIGVHADGAFRLRGSFDTPSRPPNLEIGAIPAAPTPVGAFFELPVTFIAVEPGQHTGTLTIVTYADAPNSIRVIRVRLHAIVDALVVSVVDPVPPLGRDFGTVTVGDTKTMQILVHSDSTMSAQLDSYALSDAFATAQIGVATAGIGPLAPGQTKAYWVSCKPMVVGPFVTYLSLTFVAGVFTRYTRELTVPLFWNAVGAQAELAPPTLDFGTVVVGARSAAAPVTLRNRGQLPLIVSYALVGGGFYLTGQAPTSIDAGQDEEIYIEFSPVADGPVSYSFTIASNSAQPPAPVLLTGIGLLQPLFTTRPASVSFGSVPIGSQSPPKVVEIVNAGQIVVTLQGFTITGPDAADFTITNGDRAVGDVFGLEQRLQITLVFAAQTAGMKAATLEIAHDGTTSPLRVSIDGVATAVQGLVPSVTELDLGDVLVNTDSKRRTLTFTNAAAVEANVTTVDVTGLDRADFAIVSEDCTTNPLAPGGACTVTLVAQPKEMGPRQADLAVTADVPADSVPLHAVGLDIRVEWSAALLEFDRWKVGQTSQSQTVTLHNTGNSPIEVTGLDVDGDFMVLDIVQQYTSIAPNDYKYFRVWFRPTAAGPQQGSLTVETNGPGALPALELTGIGFL